MQEQTFIFTNVLERKGEAGVLALDNAHLAEGSLADDAQQTEVVEIHYVGVVSVEVQAWHGRAGPGHGRCRCRCSAARGGGEQQQQQQQRYGSWRVEGKRRSLVDKRTHLGR